VLSVLESDLRNTKSLFWNATLKDLKTLIVTSCTGEKAVKSDRALTLTDFQKGPEHVARCERQLTGLLTEAGMMYTGQQHVRLMRGIDAFRRRRRKAFLDLNILSAGYGFVPEDRPLAPYDCTFATMKAKELIDWAKVLRVPETFREVVRRPYDLGLILLGDSYLSACDLDSVVEFGGPTLLFCGTRMANKLPQLSNLRIAPISNPEAKRFSCGLVGLKGELAKRVLERLAEDSSAIVRIMDPAVDVLAFLDGNLVAGAAAKSSRKQPVPNSKVDYVIQIPKSWWDRPHRKKLRYFIPEWDDLVDPNYDFLADTHSGGSGDWSNEVYAHQIYPEPNYDGILVSRAVAEKNRKKNARINQMGVHRYVRVPRNFSVMGDCGAFDYIEAKEPPYSTPDVLDYYTRLDFDYGVSVDHLVVPAFEAEKKFRYDLTIHNAEVFLREHRKAGLKWEPIGAIQGWDPRSYANAAAEYIKMGYRYLGLGGLVRCSTREITSILEQVHEVVPKSVNVHLFGIARPEALNRFNALGVTSVDSASHLRRAWLVARDNYVSLDGESYSSLRIPGVGKSYRAKRAISGKRIDHFQLLDLERNCLEAVRAFDGANGNVSKTIDLLLRYHELISEGGPNMRVEYERTLKATPWKRCPCYICRTWGVEVLIFRGNNRNRRRGFHNTYVFYRLMHEALATGTIVKPESPQLDLFTGSKL
jgi:hypothetical protein